MKNIDDVISEFALSHDQLRQIASYIEQEISRGLEQPQQRIKALPAYVAPPKTPPIGDVVVLDVGGSNVRAAHVRMAADAVEFINEPHANRTLMREALHVGAVDAPTFFQQQADLLTQVCPQAEFDLGYCFSFPSDNTPDGDARLNTWTKGINVEHVIGQSLRGLLSQAIERNHQHARKIPVLNDTVTTALAAGWMMPSAPWVIGLIAGTGFNLAGSYRVTDIGKLTAVERAQWTHEDMVVNLELGNAHPPFLTAYDDALDAEGIHDNPGKQRLEKAIAGHYIAPLFGRIVGREACMALPDGLAFDPLSSHAHAGYVTALRQHPSPLAQVANALIDRCADLTAAALAAVMVSQHYPQGQTTTVAILAEGSFFWLTDGYQMRVEQTLATLIPQGVEARILHNLHEVESNFIGAACATLAL